MLTAHVRFPSNEQDSSHKKHTFFKKVDAYTYLPPGLKHHNPFNYSKPCFLLYCVMWISFGGGGKKVLGVFELYVAAFRLNDRFANQRKNSKWDRAVIFHGCNHIPH